MVVWGITDGSAGMVAQVRALAVALGVEIEMKTLILPAPYRWLPSRFYTGRPAKQVAAFLLQAKVQGRAPGLVISCGRKGSAAAMALRLLMPATKFICLQDPRVPSHHFDLVVAMAHDRIEGPNVIKTRFALHDITPQKLAHAREKFLPVFEPYPAPRVAVLLGGSTNKYTLTQSGMQQLIAQLQALQKNTQASLLITPSRRTGEANTALLARAFAGDVRVYFYGGHGENPYLGLLALADYIVVTNDSVNMMSEAIATGKPVYILPLPGHANTKPTRFAEARIADGTVRGLGHTLESWSYDVPNEMAELARDIKLRLAM